MTLDRYCQYPSVSVQSFDNGTVAPCQSLTSTGLLLCDLGHGSGAWRKLAVILLGYHLDITWISQHQLVDSGGISWKWCRICWMVVLFSWASFWDSAISMNFCAEIVSGHTGHIGHLTPEVTVREEDCLSSKILGHFSAGSHLQAGCHQGKDHDLNHPRELLLYC